MVNIMSLDYRRGWSDKKWNYQYRVMLQVHTEMRTYISSPIIPRQFPVLDLLATNSVVLFLKRFHIKKLKCAVGAPHA